MRKPIVVALANYFFPGFGYVLLGKRMAFGWLLLLALIVQITQLVSDPLPPYFVVYGHFPFSIVLGVSALIICQIAFAYDAYTLAKDESN